MSHIVFVGLQRSFSDALIRAFQMLLTDVEVERVDEQSVASKAAHVGKGGLFVVEAVAARSIGREFLTALQKQAGCSIALALTDVGAVTMLKKDGWFPNIVLGALPMQRSLDEQVKILDLLSNGMSYLPQEAFEWATKKSLKDHACDEDNAEVKGLVEKRAKRSLSILTQREQQILACVAEGLQNKTIAAQLSLSEHTVKLHVHHVITKLGVTNRTQAAHRFLRQADFQSHVA